MATRFHNWGGGCWLTVISNFILQGILMFTWKLIGFLVCFLLHVYLSIYFLRDFTETEKKKKTKISVGLFCTMAAFTLWLLMAPPLGLTWHPGNVHIWPHTLVKCKVVQAIAALQEKFQTQECLPSSSSQSQSQQSVLSLIRSPALLFPGLTPILLPQEFRWRFLFGACLPPKVYLPVI